MNFQLFKTVLLLILLNFVLFNFSFAQSSAVLSTSGKSDYSILIVENDVITSNAAKQLSFYLNKVTGANFPIKVVNKSASENNTAKFIFVGSLTHLASFKPNKAIDKSKSTNESIYIDIEKGGNIYLLGGSKRSTLYAVFQFLEDYVGCRWWTPTEEMIPKKSNLKLQPTQFYYVPPFDYRSHFITNSTKDAKFATILKENGYNQPLSGEWGSRIDIVGWAHTFKQLIPVSDYFKAHPEWFSDSSNEDKPATKQSPIPNSSSYQLCLENKDLFQVFLKNTLKWIKDVKDKRPDVSIFSVSINDNEKYCRCSDAINLIRKEGSPSASLINFLNKLIIEIHKTYPDVKLQTLAYQKYITPPRTIKPHKDIIVMVAPINVVLSRGLRDNVNTKILSDIQNWGSISNENFYWGYNTNFNQFLMPFSALQFLKEDLLVLKQNNYKGIFLQDNNYTNGIGYFLDMQAWVVGKMLWNPNLNVDKLVQEFTTNYYGDGGSCLYEYYTLLSTAFKNSSNKHTPFSMDFSYINKDILKQCNDLFDKALIVTKNNRIHQDRVSKERFVLDYMNNVMFNYNPTKKSRQADLNNFNKRLQKAGVKKTGINQSVIDNIYGTADKLSTITGLEVSKEGGAIVIQEAQFVLDQKGKLTDLYRDTFASNKLSASIDGSAKGWSVQIQPGKNAHNLNPKTDYKVQVSMKVAVKGNTKSWGNVEFGLYNTSTKKLKIKKLIKVSDISQKSYTILSVFNTKIETSDIIYVSLKDATVDKMYIDKFEIAKE